MKKEDIKKEFEVRLNNIEVSDELFKNTMGRIIAKGNVRKYLVPVWLKSCACIILVGGLVTLAYINNQEDKNLIEIKMIGNDTVINNQENLTADTASDEVKENYVKAEEPNKKIKADFSAPKATQQEANSVNSLYKTSEVKDINSNLLRSEISGDVGILAIHEEEEKVKVGDSKEKIFEEYNDVKEVDGNYVVKIGDIEKTFVISEGKIIQIY